MAYKPKRSACYCITQKLAATYVDSYIVYSMVSI
jgi:hypothetical protein